MPKNREIVVDPHPALRKRSVELENTQIKGVQELITDLILAMFDHDGVGIAAPQVGVNQRICIIRTAEGPLALVNPEITFKSKRLEAGEEGCLSIPGVWGDVKRHVKIRIKALTHQGRKISFAAEDLFARIIQHEIDHLDGVLFTDKATNIRKAQKKKQF